MIFQSLTNVVTGQITYAVRDTEIEGQKISEGDILGLAEGKIKAVTKDVKETLLDLIKEIVDDDSEYVTLYYGEDVTEDDAEAIAEELEEKYPDIEFSVNYGGQSLYYYIISVE